MNNLQVKVIDMTGKEQRVLSGYHAIAAQQMPDDYDEREEQERKVHQKSVFDLPELKHNIDLILDKCEDQLISADRALKHHKNKVRIIAVMHFPGTSGENGISRISSS